MSLRDWLSWAPWLRRLVAQGLISNQETESVVGPAWRLLSTDRPKRFNEMEYHLPEAALKACLEEVIAAVERHSEVYFRRFDGRPHWGKLHSLGARELAPLYPRWREFTELRRTYDPASRFLNRHLRNLFGG